MVSRMVSLLLSEDPGQILVLDPDTGNYQSLPCPTMSTLYAILSSTLSWCFALTLVTINHFPYPTLPCPTYCLVVNTIMVLCSDTGNYHFPLSLPLSSILRVPATFWTLYTILSTTLSWCWTLTQACHQSLPSTCYHINNTIRDLVNTIDYLVNTISLLLFFSIRRPTLIFDWPTIIFWLAHSTIWLAGTAPLHQACYVGHTSCVKLMVNKVGSLLLHRQ